MLGWVFKCVSRLGAATMLVGLGWLGWQNLGPQKPQVGEVRRRLADSLMPQIVEDIRLGRGDLRNVALLHLENDPSDYLTESLRAALERSGVLNLRDRTFAEKLRALLNIREHGHGQASEAIARGRKLGADGVIFGRVHTFELQAGEPVLDLEVALANVPSGRVVFSRRYQPRATFAGTLGQVVGRSLGRVEWFKRALAWAVIVLLLPIFTIGFIRAMVRAGSNRRNAFTLAIYTIVDAFVAFLLVGGSLHSWFATLVFATAVVLAFFYNVRIVAFAVKLES